jgi:hypothetical protein
MSCPLHDRYPALQLWSESWRDYKASWKLLSREEPEVPSEAEQAEGGVSGAQLREDIGEHFLPQVHASSMASSS